MFAKTHIDRQNLGPFCDGILSGSWASLPDVGAFQRNESRCAVPSSYRCNYVPGLAFIELALIRCPLSWHNTHLKRDIDHIGDSNTSLELTLLGHGFCHGESSTCETHGNGSSMREKKHPPNLCFKKFVLEY